MNKIFDCIDLILWELEFRIFHHTKSPIYFFFKKYKDGKRSKEEKEDDLLKDSSLVKVEIKRRIENNELTDYGSLKFPYWALIRATNLGKLKWSMEILKERGISKNISGWVANLENGYKLRAYFLPYVGTRSLDLMGPQEIGISVLNQDYEGKTGFDLERKRSELMKAIKDING
jgi:hypothetical protein